MRKMHIAYPHPAMEEGVGQLSSASLLAERNKYNSAHEDENDEGDSGAGKRRRRWQQPGCLSDGIGHGSSAVPLLGGGDRDANDSSATKVLNEGCRSANFYENVFNEGLIHQQQLSFGGSGYGKLRKCKENIYENICEDCGRLYSAEKCAFCAVEDAEDVDRTKKSSKYSAKFQEFLGNFRIRPVRLGGGVTGSTIQGKRKICKSDIVHNVDGFEDVFRTNKSFDLGEICRMRNDARSQVSVDEETADEIMTEKTLAVISQNIDNTVFPTVPQQSSPTTIQKPPQSLSPGVPHSPTFSGPAANKPQIPVSDSCVGTYTSKSAENLPDVVAPQEKEKSPNPKRERMRDKLMNALPSMNSSRHPNDGLVFGVELSLVEQDDKFKVPRFVVECVEILKEQENIETSGLYRASGNKNSIENIKKKLNEKRSPKKYEFLKKQDVHSLTGSLKLFFRELKSPLIAKDVYESCVQQTKDEVKTIEQIKLSIAKMDLINRNTLHYLIRHLKCVHQHSDVNMMNSSNLAIVWGACLFASTLGLMESYENNDLGKINTLVKQLIDHYDKIFYDDKSD